MNPKLIETMRVCLNFESVFLLGSKRRLKLKLFHFENSAERI